MKGKKQENPMPLLRDRLHGLESDAPGLGWDSFQQHRKKRRMVVWWHTGAVLLAVISIAALFNGYRKSDEKQALLNAEPVAAPKGNQKPNHVQHAWSSARANEAGIAGTKPEIPIRRAITAGKPVTPDSTILPGLPVAPADTCLLSELPLRPIVRLPESAFQPQSGSRALLVKQLNPNQTDSWQWYWGLSLGAGFFRPVTQATGTGQAFIHRDYSAIRRKFEVGLFSHNLRLQTAAIKGDWMFTAGIGIHRQATQANYDFLYSEAPVIDGDGRIIAYAASNPQRIAFSSTHHLTTTELPVSVAWRWKKARDYNLYLRLSAAPSFLGSIKGTLPDPVLLDRREKFSPVNYRLSSQSFSLAMPLLLRTSTNGRLEFCPEWKWHSGLRQIQGHYLSRYNQTGITCSYYVHF
jgi:hypothetical protein